MTNKARRRLAEFRREHPRCFERTTWITVLVCCVVALLCATLFYPFGKIFALRMQYLGRFVTLLMAFAFGGVVAASWPICRSVEHAKKRDGVRYKRMLSAVVDIAGILGIGLVVLLICHALGLNLEALVDGSQVVIYALFENSHGWRGHLAKLLNAVNVSVNLLVFVLGLALFWLSWGRSNLDRVMKVLNRAALSFEKRMNSLCAGKEVA